MPDAADAPWSATKGPRGEHITGAEPIPDPILSPVQREHVEGLFTYCFGDEENHSPALITQLEGLFAQMRTEAPDALLHTNQYAYQWTDEQMIDYIQRCRPDLITFDDYNFSWNSQSAHGSVTKAYDMTMRTRGLALLGHDLSGRDPLQFGQYSMGFRSGDEPWQEGFDYIVSQSQQYLVPFLTWTLGGRWLDMFRWQRGAQALLTHEDGSRTPQYDRVRALNARRAALSPFLTRLRSQEVAMIPGSSEQGPSPESRIPVLTADFDPACRISAIEVENIGGANDGLPGDVVVGSFRPIPGMTEQEAGVFTDPGAAAFMLMNALVLPNDDPRDEDGTGGNGAETRQRITLSFAAAGRGDAVPGTLRTVDQSSGAERAVRLRRAADGTWQAALELDGGTAELLWWTSR